MSGRVVFRIFAGILCFVLCVGFTKAAVTEDAKLTASDGAGGDRFGNSVSISGDYAIVGASWDDDDGSGSGSAYIFRFNGTIWVEEAKLLASDGDGGDEFGRSVSIDGDYAIIGAMYNDNGGGYGYGSAYIFKRDGTSWSEQAKLVASDGAAGDYFGGAVSISGDYAIIGAPYDDDNGYDSGSAYIFKRDGESWSEQAKLVASDCNLFGCSVSISGDYAIVGVYSDCNIGSGSCSAYIFKRDGIIWSEQAKLTAPDYISSLSISGDYAILGVHGDDDNGYNSGAAYIFKRDGETWSQQDKLFASDCNDSDLFGCSVSISGDYVIVGARFDDDNGEDSGSAYIFKCVGTSWQQVAKLVASDGADNDWFGHSVSINGDYAIAGAPRNEDYTGSAYVFSGFVGLYVPWEYPTIQGAIDDSNDGDVVIIEPNVYTGSGNRDLDFLGKAITVRSINPNDPCVVAATIIDCNGSPNEPHRGFYFHSGEGPNSVLSGLTITNGFMHRGGGIRCDLNSSPKIEFCRIISNIASYSSVGYGGGVYCDRSDPIFSNCIIAENTAFSGGPFIGLGGGIYIRGNGFGHWEQMAEPNIINCTIFGNSADFGGGIVIAKGCDVDIYNCILWGNSAEDGHEVALELIYDVPSPYVTISYCDVQGGREEVYESGGELSWENNIDSNPLFVNAAAGDFHLLSDSPCFNAGDPNYIPEPGESDIDGEPRVMGCCVDMGADEFFTEECYAGMPDYDQWELVGKPECWCYPRQCLGDADGLPYGKQSWWVATPDLMILKSCWQIPGGPVGDLACADFDHLPYGKSNWRVGAPDLAILKSHWQIDNGPAGTCGPGNRNP